MTLSPHPVDHLVLPTAGIFAARERLGKLGFTVAPDARHPFGTENACVFFSDQTYLEPLGVFDRAAAEASAKDGNVFTARDQAFRFRCGEDGFGGVALGTEDAAADHGYFRRRGMSAGDMLNFSRPVRLSDGSTSTASFRLAFAGDLRAPDFLGFCCQRIDPLPADRSSLETHGNGVAGIKEIVLSAHEPAAFGAFLGSLVRQHDIVRHSFGIHVATANMRICVLDPEGMEAFFELPVPEVEHGLRGRAIVFRVSDIAVTEALLAANSVTYTRKNNRILTRAAPGQGALFAFEES
ncbi:VOC family protein [Rhizobium sp. BK251]|uniref:VOC family protein n=1 Tax=Rhizobium sp. BK251 TaxID=2512125 RepID=UPI0010438FDE|nr:VOC family protein [Rhizobium sp. BK251]TCL73690.1 glyoxalase-like protein [Rhizobium sp. BK251]